jgi:hypothetical protein
MSDSNVFDVSEEAVESVNKALAGNPRRNDRRICICGASMARHNLQDGTVNVLSFESKCRRPFPVLKVKNTRHFVARTIGSGESHALVRGYMASKAAIPDFEEGVEWLIEFKCENPKCGKPTKVFPTMVDELGYRLRDTEEEDKGITIILCEVCREVYSDSEEAIQARRDSIKSVPST